MSVSISMNGNFSLFKFFKSNKITYLRTETKNYFRTVFIFCVDSNIKSISNLIYNPDIKANIKIQKSIISHNDQNYLNSYLIIEMEVENQKEIDICFKEFKNILKSIREFMKTYKIEFKLLSTNDQKKLNHKIKFHSKFSQLLPVVIYDDYDKMLTLFFNPRLKVLKLPPPTSILGQNEIPIVVGKSIEKYDIGFSEYPVLLTGNNLDNRRNIIKKIVSQMIKKEDRLIILDFGLGIQIEEKHKIRSINFQSVNFDPFLSVQNVDLLTFTKHFVRILTKLYYMSDRQISLFEDRFISYLNSNESNKSWIDFQIFFSSESDSVDTQGDNNLTGQLENSVTKSNIDSFLTNLGETTKNNEVEFLLNKISVLNSIFYGNKLDQSLNIIDFTRKPGIVYLDLRKQSPDIKYLIFELFNLVLLGLDKQNIIFLDLDSIKFTSKYKTQLIEENWMSYSYRNAIYDLTNMNFIEEQFSMFKTKIFTSLENNNGMSYKSSNKMLQNISYFLNNFKKFNALLRIDYSEPFYFKIEESPVINYNYPDFTYFSILVDVIFNFNPKYELKEFNKVLKRLLKEKWLSKDKDSLILTEKSFPLKDLLHKILYFQPDLTQDEIRISIYLQENRLKDEIDIKTIFRSIKMENFTTHLLAQQFKGNIIDKRLLFNFVQFLNRKISELDLVHRIHGSLQNSLSANIIDSVKTEMKTIPRPVIISEKPVLNNVVSSPAPIPIVEKTVPQSISNNLLHLDSNMFNALSKLSINALQTINERIKIKFDNEFSYPVNSIIILKKYLDESLREQIDNDLQKLSEETDELTQITM